MSDDAAGREVADPGFSDTGIARVAVYHAPAFDDPLWRRAASWLGRDPETNAKVGQPLIEGLAGLTADPSHYGFHATLKPPMRLAAGQDWNSLVEATEKLAASIAPFDLPRLEVADFKGFLALRESEPCPALQSLADRCVGELDAFRAPPDEAELARRRNGRLTEAQDAMLARWGYPYVFETWFFHMTLTRRLSADEHARIRPALENHFSDVMDRPRRVTDVCLFTQASLTAPFNLAIRLPLLGAASR